MVTARDNTGLSYLARKRFTSALSKIGSSNFTLYRTTRTTGAMNQVTAVSEAAIYSNFVGSLQFLTVQDKQLIQIGWAKVGDGIFYCEQDKTILENDELVQGSDTTRWVITKQIEGEKVDGSKTYQAWVATRKEV